MPPSRHLLRASAARRMCDQHQGIARQKLTEPAIKMAERQGLDGGDFVQVLAVSCNACNWLLCNALRPVKLLIVGRSWMQFSEVRC